MRQIPPALQAKLDAGATTICACWRVDPKSGTPLGFTDHDADIAFDGVTYEAESGFVGSSVERSLGLATDNATTSGALRSDKLDETMIRRGRLDGAEIRQYIVDWSEPDLRLLSFRGEFGEIRRGQAGFSVEIRGLSERLNRPVGRSFTHVCDANLGDARCGVDASAPLFKGTGAISTVIDARTVQVSGLNGFQSDWFTFGEFRWVDGPLAGDVSTVRSHRKLGGAVELQVDRDFIETPLAGQGFTIVAGCDKRLPTCREKFLNHQNFRGFPFIPGESWMAAYPAEGGAHDGGSRDGD